MTNIERYERIKALQGEIDQLIEGCEDGECCPCPTCQALEDMQAISITARSMAENAAWPFEIEAA